MCQFIEESSGSDENPTNGEAVSKVWTPPASAAWRFNFYLVMSQSHFQIPPTLVAWSFNFGLVIRRKMAEIETPRD